MAMRNLFQVTDIARLSPQLKFVRFLILTDGSVYENMTYECDAPKLSGTEVEQYFKTINSKDK